MYGCTAGSDDYSPRIVCPLLCLAPVLVLCDALTHIHVGLPPSAQISAKQSRGEAIISLWRSVLCYPQCIDTLGVMGLINIQITDNENSHFFFLRCTWTANNKSADTPRLRTADYISFLFFFQKIIYLIFARFSKTVGYSTKDLLKNDLYIHITDHCLPLLGKRETYNHRNKAVAYTQHEPHWQLRRPRPSADTGYGSLQTIWFLWARGFPCTGLPICCPWISHNRNDPKGDPLQH